MPGRIAASTTFVQGHAYKTMKRAAPTVVSYSRNNNSGKVSTSVSGADEGNNWTITWRSKWISHCTERCWHTCSR